MSRVFFQPEAVFRQRACDLADHQAASIRALIPSARIEHIGGTSVIGALTKGDVDLAVTVEPGDFAPAVRAFREVYVVNQPENWTPFFASFKDDTSYALPLGIQLGVAGSETYSFTRLRDRLRSDPSALARYNALKQAHAGGDETAYREAKGEFIERLLADG